MTSPFSPPFALFLAKLCVDEAEPHEVDGFVAWAQAHGHAGPRLRQLGAMRPITDELDPAFLMPALAEAGLAVPAPLDAVMALARDAMRRVVAGELSPEEGAGLIDNWVYGGAVPFDVASEIPALWNFCVYRRYLRAACDVADDAWYGQVVDDIGAEAEYHLGLRARPPG